MPRYNQSIYRYPSIYQYANLYNRHSKVTQLSFPRLNTETYELIIIIRVSGNASILLTKQPPCAFPSFASSQNAEYMSLEQCEKLSSIILPCVSYTQACTGFIFMSSILFSYCIKRGLKPERYREQNRPVLREFSRHQRLRLFASEKNHCQLLGTLSLEVIETPSLLVTGRCVWGGGAQVIMMGSL